jgi:hypothetical protein
MGDHSSWDELYPFMYFVSLPQGKRKEAKALLEERE